MDFTSDYSIEDRKQNMKKHMLSFIKIYGTYCVYTLKKVYLQIAHTKNGKKRAWSIHSLVLHVA